MKRAAPPLDTPPKRFRPAPTLKRSAPQMFHPAKRQRTYIPPIAPAPDPQLQMGSVLAQLLQYVTTLEQRIAILESKVRAPAEPFSAQPGIVVF